MTAPASVPETVLTIRGLHGGYGDIPVLDGVDIEVRRGEVVAVLGANGAGKTTLLRAISGLLPTVRGSIDFLGSEIAGLRPEVIARRGLAHVPESRCIFPGLTVGENLATGLFARARTNSSAQARIDEVVHLFPWMAGRMRQRGADLSGGEQQMLAVGRALMGEPTMLILDEPSLGLSPRMGNEVFVALARISAGGVPMILVEQSLNLSLQIATRGYVLNRGRVVEEAGVEELVQSSAIDSAYFG